MRRRSTVGGALEMLPLQYWQDLQSNAFLLKLSRFFLCRCREFDYDPQNRQNFGILCISLPQERVDLENLYNFLQD